MISIAICDDDVSFALRFKEELNSELSKQNIINDESKIVYYQNSDELFANYEKDKIDVFFLDIEFGNDLGMDVARKLERFIPDVRIVYITNHECYAPRAYVCRPLGFIRKNNVKMDTGLALIAVLENIAKEVSEIKLSIAGETRIINCSSLMYIKSNNHHVELYFVNDTLCVRDRISRLEKELNDYMFFKIDRTCIVNFKYVENFDGEVVIMADDSKQYVTIERRKELLLNWQKYKMKF